MNQNAESRGGTPPERQRWYEGIGRYQWLVLTVASLGWIFDVFEGQVFVASMREAMPSLVGGDAEMGQIDFLNKIAMASFLFGGALGGVLFGALADRIGRSKTLAITILVYSLFTLITAFTQSPWQMIVLRFVVALGTGGEWAVGAAFVAEVFPKRSRPWMGSIFHALVRGRYLSCCSRRSVHHRQPRARRELVAMGFRARCPACGVGLVDSLEGTRARALGGGAKDGRSRVTAERERSDPLLPRAHQGHHARSGAGDDRYRDLLGRAHLREERHASACDDGGGRRERPERGR